jgi:hypothetical protein
MHLLLLPLLLLQFLGWLLQTAWQQGPCSCLKCQKLPPRPAAIA